MPTAPATDESFAAFEAKLAAKGYKPRGWLDVIDSCNFHDRRTNQKVELGRDRLQAIADKRNKLVLERESVSHFCLGHTDDDAPEWEQPPLAGLASRWRVGSYADGTPNLEAYSWENPGHEGVFDQYPQRSAELFLNPDDINPIALLKSTTPRRDLSLRLSRDFDAAPTKTSGRSLVRFWRDPADSARRPILFQLRGAEMGETPVKCDEDGGPPKAEAPESTGPDSPTPGAGWIDQLFASDQWKQAMAKIDKAVAFADKAAPIFEELEQEATGGADGGAPPGGAVPPAAPPGAAPPVDAGGPPPGGPAPPPEEEGPKGPPTKNSALGSTAGYGNTTMPTYEHERLARTYDQQTAVRLQRVEADNARMAAENAALKRQLEDNTQVTAALKLSRMEDETNVLLDVLSREGIKLDRDDDFKALVRLSKDDRAKAADKMRALRQRVEPAVPGGGKAVIDPASAALPAPVRFSRPGDLPGDPVVVGQALPDDYDALVALAGNKGQGVAVPPPASPAPVAVR